MSKDNQIYGPGNDNYGRDKKFPDNQKLEREYNLLAGLTENEAYLYGVIAGQKKRIEQLENSPSIETIVEQVLEYVANHEIFTTFSDVHITAAIEAMHPEIVKLIKEKLK